MARRPLPLQTVVIYVAKHVIAQRHAAAGSEHLPMRTPDARRRRSDGSWQHRCLPATKHPITIVTKEETAHIGAVYDAYYVGEYRK